MKHCTHQLVIAFCSFFILLLTSQTGNTQIYYRWDFNLGKEGWDAGGKSYDENGYIIPYTFAAQNGELKIDLPENLIIESLKFKRDMSYLSELKDLTMRLTSSHSFYIQALVMSLSGTIVKSNIIHKSPNASYQEITLVFENPVPSPKIIYIYLDVENEPGKSLQMSVDWIEANSPPNNEVFNLFLNPPGNVIQKGEQGEFNLLADWNGSNNLIGMKKRSLQLQQNIFDLVEDSPYGELVDVVVGETSAQATFLFTAQELGEHLVNFTATLENGAGNPPLEIIEQLPIYVTDFDPHTLFNETSSAKNWMLYKN